MKHRNLIAVILIGAALSFGCSTGPSPIVVGRHQCAHCKMVISDLRFAAQFITENGKRYTFDSVECLVHGMRSADAPVREAWVSDYEMSGTWVPVERAVYLYSGGIHSPMGAGLAAFGPPATPSEVRAAYGGTVMTWSEVRTWVKRTEHGHIAAGGHGVDGGLSE